MEYVVDGIAENEDFGTSGWKNIIFKYSISCSWNPIVVKEVLRECSNIWLRVDYGKKDDDSQRIETITFSAQRLPQTRLQHGWYTRFLRYS